MGSVAPGEAHTVRNRCTQVTALAAASSHIATGSAGGQATNGKSDTPAPTNTMISRSGRSMTPPSPRSPGGR